MLNELLSMYEDAIEDAQSLWLSDYCSSEEEKQNRINEDNEKVEIFKKRLELVRYMV